MENQDLLNEFPDLKNKIQELKVSDVQFRNLYDEYHEVNNSINIIEASITPASDEKLNELLLKRILLKNKLAAYSSLE
jgi:uncharacterized protein YdcH (DUF465 family)